MAVRQYIGARYVTKIYENSLDPSSAEWEASTAYEPLTMVTYNNSSYLSKKEVPNSVGDPANNPLYWVVTGAYNGQIAALQSQITAINTIIGDANSGIIKDINDINNELTAMSKRKFILMGDSFGYGVINAGEFATKGWIKYCTDVINSIPNCEALYLLSSQASIAGNNGFGSTYPYSTQLTDLIAANPNYDFSEITDIIIIGGTNDISAIANVADGFDAFMTVVNTSCPNAKIKCGLIGRRAYDLKNTVAPVYMSKCCEYGVTYDENLLNLMCNPGYYTASGHVTEVGYNFYNPYVLQNILNGKAYYNFSIGCDLTVDSNYDVSAHTLKLYFNVTNEDVDISLVDAGSNRFTAAMIAMTNFITADKQNYTFATGVFPETVKDNSGFTDVRFYFKGTSDQYHFYPLSEGRFYKSNGTLYFNNGYTYPNMAAVIADHTNSQFLTWSV